MEQILSVGKRKRRRFRTVNSDPVGYLLIMPFFLFTSIFVIAPIISNIYLSFTNYDLIKMDFVGLRNYQYMVHDDALLISLKNSLIFTIFTLPLNMGLGLLIAIFLKGKIFGLKFFRTSFYTPYISSMVAASMIWLWMLEPSSGIFTQILGLFKIGGQKWLFQPSTALATIIVVSVWKALGYYMVIYLAGLQAIPNYLYEAAKIDGASAWKRFWHVTYPMLKPVTFFLFVTGFINNFRVFEQVQIMTNGGPANATTTIVHQIYNRAFNQMTLGYAASEAVLLLAIVLFVTLINFKYGNQGAELEAA
jgi:ABC-type sugar transport system permease subunit